MKSIEENYEYVQNIWKEKKFPKFSDYLAFYNNADVIGFVKAVERFLDFYRKLKIDVFKDSLSVTGISRKLLFQTAREQNIHFSIFSKPNSDLYFTIRDNIGGPSLIFTRYQEVDKTFIRPNSNKICKNILGYDIYTALYY